MAKAEASVEELVGMIERGERRLPEMQRQYVWRSTCSTRFVETTLWSRGTWTHIPSCIHAGGSRAEQT